MLLREILPRSATPRRRGLDLPAAASSAGNLASTGGSLRPSTGPWPRHRTSVSRARTSSRHLGQDFQELHRRRVGRSRDRRLLREPEPGRTGRPDRPVPRLRSPRTWTRGPLGQARLRALVAHAGARARRRPAPGRRPAGRAEGRDRRRDDAGDGQGRSPRPGATSRRGSTPPTTPRPKGAGCSATSCPRSCATSGR